MAEAARIARAVGVEDGARAVAGPQYAAGLQAAAEALVGPATEAGARAGAVAGIKAGVKYAYATSVVRRCIERDDKGQITGTLEERVPTEQSEA